MKLVAEYLEKALDFEAMASKESDPKLKDSLLNRCGTRLVEQSYPDQDT